MKPVTILLLAASLVFNAVLASAALSGHARVSAARDAAANAPRSPASAGAVDPQTWSRLETEDLAALVTRLRDAGFPREVIRAMVKGLLAEQFEARRRALDPGAGGRPFWKDQTDDFKLQLAQLQLAREQAKTLRTLLGPDAADTDPLVLARLRGAFGDLPPGKLDATQLILEDFEQRRVDLGFKNGGISPADVLQLGRDQHAALAAVLSPAELEEYDLRNSYTGQILRRELAAFEPTEEEFRAIYRLRQTFDEKFGFLNGIPTQDVLNQRAPAQKQLAADIQALLSPERAADFERAGSASYQRTAQLVSRLELPSTNAVSLWNLQKEMEKRRGEIYSASDVTETEQRSRQLTALEQEAIARINPLLGGPGRIDAYRLYGGQWLQTLVYHPGPPPP